MRIPTLLIAPPAIALLVAASGCTSRSTTFEGYGEDQVWSAMVAAARTPEYDDWKVRDNEVYVDESGRRLEVFRILKRLYVTPHSDPRKEEEEWRLQIVLSHDGDLGAPTVDFTARQVSVPAHVWREADRYFAQVRMLLGPAATPQTEATPPAADGDPTPTPPPLPTEQQPSPAPATEAARPTEPPEQLPEH
jgi:hypothetical protein